MASTVDLTEQVACPTRISRRQVLGIVGNGVTGGRTASSKWESDHGVVDGHAVAVARRNCDGRAGVTAGHGRKVAVPERQQPIVLVVHIRQCFGGNRPLRGGRAWRLRLSHRVLRHRRGLIDDDDKARARLGHRDTGTEQCHQRDTAHRKDCDALTKPAKDGLSHRDSCLRNRAWPRRALVVALSRENPLFIISQSRAGSARRRVF